MTDKNSDINKLYSQEYKYGFKTDVDTFKIAKGLTKETIHQISSLKKEPQFLLDFRLNAFEQWKQMTEPHWANFNYPPIDYQNLHYYAEPQKKPKLNSLDEVDPEILKTFEKLGIPLEEQKLLSNVAVEMVFDSVSIGVTFKEKLLEAGVILCSISEAIQKYPELIKKYLGSVVPVRDNFFSALNSAVFSDGSFVYIPKGVTCPMELSTYFRINEQETGQFERTLIIADEGSKVSYLEGCTAPAFSSKQLHAAVVELVALDNAEIKYSTVQNWFSGDPKDGSGGVYNFVTKRGLCKGYKSKISWTQVEVGSAITWKYPSCILQGDNSVGEFYSAALTNNFMKADTGTKMIHLGNNTSSTIISKGISADKSENTYRGLVKVAKNAKNSRNYTQCDSMLVGNQCSANTFPTIDVKNSSSTIEANTFPTIDVKNSSSTIEHEASTSKLNEEQLFYFQSRGIEREDSINMIVNGFCKDVIKELPLEFATEAQKLLTLKLENSIG